MSAIEKNYDFEIGKSFWQISIFVNNLGLDIVLTLLEEEHQPQGEDKPVENEKHLAYIAKVEENKEVRRILEYVAKAVWNKESETATNMAYTPFEETEFYDPEVTFDLFAAPVNI